MRNPLISITSQIQESNLIKLVCRHIGNTSECSRLPSVLILYAPVSTLQPYLRHANHTELLITPDCSMQNLLIFSETSWVFACYIHQN